MNRVCEVCFDPADLASAPAGFFSIARALGTGRQRTHPADSA
jgi:hypothetical protein